MQIALQYLKLFLFVYFFH